MHKFNIFMNFMLDKYNGVIVCLAQQIKQNPPRRNEGRRRKHMTKEFENRVNKEGSVDTKNYRYCVRDNKIVRIALDKLDTTAALTDWEIVKQY